MDLITVTVKYNVSTFLWNMANPQEFWNHRLQAKIFTLLISDAFWGGTQAQDEVVQSTFFAEQGCSELSKSGTSTVSWILRSRMKGH